MRTRLNELLAREKTAIVDGWREAVHRTYSPDMARFLVDQPNQFANPVGHTVSTGLARLYDGLLEGFDADAAREALDGIVRIRAVQDFTPSQAVAFVYGLKAVVRKRLGAEANCEEIASALVAFESDVDRLALLAFDIYMECRERLHSIKTRERSMMNPPAPRLSRRARTAEALKTESCAAGCPSACESSTQCNPNGGNGK